MAQSSWTPADIPAAPRDPEPARKPPSAPDPDIGRASPSLTPAPPAGAGR
jgi:hypothetical protein